MILVILMLFSRFDLLNLPNGMSPLPEAFFALEVDMFWLFESSRPERDLSPFYALNSSSDLREPETEIEDLLADPNISSVSVYSFDSTSSICSKLRTII